MDALDKTSRADCDLYHCFLLDKLEQVRGLERVDPVVAYTPHDSADFFKTILLEGFTLIPQTGDHLGKRLANVSGYLFEQGYEKVVILDSDSPNLPSGYIYDGLECLDKADAVIGPCLDGGYYLIGLRSHIPELFRNIPWSTGKVTESTLERAASMGISVSLIDEHELPPLGGIFPEFGEEIIEPYDFPVGGMKLQIKDKIEEVVKCNKCNLYWRITSVSYYGDTMPDKIYCPDCDSFLIQVKSNLFGEQTKIRKKQQTEIQKS